MRALVRDRGVDLTEEKRAAVERALHFALDRFASRVDAVTVGLTDVNGPRGGIDKRCRIEVALNPSGLVFIEEMGQDVMAAVHVAAQRAGAAVARKLQRDRGQ